MNTLLANHKEHFKVLLIRRRTRHLERMPVTLSAAKGLARRTQRSFAALRMTARTPLKSAHGKSSLQMSGRTSEICHMCLHLAIYVEVMYTNTYFECFHLVDPRSANRVARKEDHPHREEQTWLKMLHPPQAHRSLATPWYSISPVLFAACTARKCSPTMALRSSW